MNKTNNEKLIILDNIDIQPLISTRDFLARALKEGKNEFEIAGAIQAFEVCYELAWKTLRKVFILNGIEIIGSRDVFRIAAQKGLITDYKNWFTYQNKRNITTHEYFGEIEEKVYPSLPEFLKDLDILINNLKKMQ